MQASEMAEKYDDPVDRESAFEILKQRAEAAATAAEKAEAEEEALKDEEREFKTARRYESNKTGRSTSRRSSSSSSGGFGGKLASSIAKELTGSKGRRLVRGILGGLFKGR